MEIAPSHWHVDSNLPLLITRKPICARAGRGKLQAKKERDCNDSFFKGYANLCYNVSIHLASEIGSLDQVYFHAQF